MNEVSKQILSDARRAMGDNVLEFNPNGSLNYRLTVINIVKKLAGGTLVVGETAVINEESVRELANEWMLVSETPFELNASDNIIREFNRYMRGGRQDGSVFFVGRGYYDVTILILNDQIKWSSAVAGMYAADSSDAFREVAQASAAKAEQLSTWARKYAQWIGLNEDAR